jgi:hypothetical protein
MPPEITLSGENRFTDPLADPAQAWVVSSRITSYPALLVKNQSFYRVGDLTLQLLYTESLQGNSLPGNFTSPPIIDTMAWDWIEFHYQPLENLEVECIYWAPDPRVICGIHRVQLSNSRIREISLLLSCQAGKSKQSISLAGQTYQGRKILSGSSQEHNAVLFLAGSEISPAAPSNQLRRTVVIEPGEVVEFRWVLVCCDRESNPRRIVHEVIELDWGGEIGRRKITHSGQFQIRTVSDDWDFALAFSQRQARLIFNQLRLLAQSKDPEDLDLEPLQVWQLIQALLPLDSLDLLWLLRAAFRKNIGKEPSFPIDAELSWLALQSGIEPGNLREFVSAITENLQAWFSQTNDRDGDGIPEEPREDFFLLDRHYQQEVTRWKSPPRHVDYLETPGLAALLHHEISQLTTIAEIIPGIEIPDNLSKQLSNLEDFLINSWQEDESRFRSRDYLNHFSEGGFTLPRPLEEGWNLLRFDLPFPAQIRLRIPSNSAKNLTSTIRITLLGTDFQGNHRVEELTSQDFIWNEQGGWGISQSIFQHLDHCVVTGGKEYHQIQIEVPGTDRQDISQSFSLWLTSMPADIVEKFISKSLTDPSSFWSDFGIKSYPLAGNTAVQLPLNILAAQGLIKSGLPGLAGKILSRLMDTSSTHISQKGNLFSTWESKTGSGLGKTGNVEGILPIGLLLDLLGIRFLVNGKLFLDERNPFIFPVQVLFRGTEITLREHETMLRKPNGKKAIFPRGEMVEIQL